MIVTSLNFAVQHAVVTYFFLGLILAVGAQRAALRAGLPYGSAHWFVNALLWPITLGITVSRFISRRTARA